MRRKILAGIGAPILLASTLLAGSAAVHKSKSTSKAQTVACIGAPQGDCSDVIEFHGTLQVLPSPEHPSIFVITQNLPAYSTTTCAVLSDGPAETKPLPCQGTSHGTITLTFDPYTSAVTNITFSGTTTFASTDGVITLTGMVPTSGTSTITGTEKDPGEPITTGITVTGHATVNVAQLMTTGKSPIDALITIHEKPSITDPF